MKVGRERAVTARTRGQFAKVSITVGIDAAKRWNDEMEATLRAARIRRVLVLDDEACVVDDLKSQLSRKFGEAIGVETFVEPQAALKRLRETRVDILMSDLRMPGMDGLSFMRQARLAQPDAVRIMLLGPTDFASVINDERQAELFRYLSKPWTDEQLFMHFQAALDKLEPEFLPFGQEGPRTDALVSAPVDEFVLPSQLQTLPGDLWVA